MTVIPDTLSTATSACNTKRNAVTALHCKTAVPSASTTAPLKLKFNAQLRENVVQDHTAGPRARAWS